MTPFMEQQALWEQISNPSTLDATNPTTPLTAPAIWRAMGPAPNRIEYAPWATEIPTLRCPSDPGTGLPALGRTNYAACLGDSIDWSVRGPLHLECDRLDNCCRTMVMHSGPARRTGASSFRTANPSSAISLTGLSNTISMGEIATDLGDRDTRTIQT